MRTGALRVLIVLPMFISCDDSEARRVRVMDADARLVAESPALTNDPLLEELRPKFELVGTEGSVTFYYAEGIRSSNALLYLAFAGKNLYPLHAKEFGNGKILLLCHRNGSNAHAAMVNYRQHRPVDFYVAPNVDEIVALKDADWEAINAFVYQFYNVYRGELSIEEEESLRQAITVQMGVSNEIWMKRVDALIQKNVTDGVTAIIENRMLVGPQ